MPTPRDHMHILRPALRVHDQMLTSTMPWNFALRASSLNSGSTW